jgi:hypothetical protein
MMKPRFAMHVMSSALAFDNLFIPAFVNAQGQRVHYGNVVAIYSERPRVIDYLHVLNRSGLRVNIQYSNRAEAMRERMKREQKGSVTKNLKKEISHESTINEKRANVSSIPKGKTSRKRMWRILKWKEETMKIVRKRAILRIQNQIVKIWKVSLRILGWNREK